MLEDKGFFEVLILVHLGLIEDSGVEQDIGLLVSLTEGFIFAFFEIEELILHIDSFLILDNDDLIIRVVSLVLETA